MPTESHGAKGDMYLSYYFHESSGSGHIEDYADVKLSAKDDNTVSLIESKGHMNYLKRNGNTNIVKQYDISVDELIRLIKEYGTEI